MTQVIIRYGCDGPCGRYFENKDDLNVVDVQQWRGLNGGQGVYTTDRTELWCGPCLREKETLNRQPHTYSGPSRTAPGFRLMSGTE